MMASLTSRGIDQNQDSCVVFQQLTSESQHGNGKSMIVILNP